MLFVIALQNESAQNTSYELSDQRKIGGEVYSSKSYLVRVPGIGTFQGPLHESGLYVFGSKDGVSGFAFVSLYSNGPEVVYEYRFGTLIPGNMVDKRFIPRQHGVIIALQHYVNESRKERIYNLPGTLVRKAQSTSNQTSSKKNVENEGREKTILPGSDYVCQQDLSKKYLLKVGVTTLYGTLNQHGDFIPDDVHHIVHGKFASEQIGEWLIRDDDEGEAYEFRSGRLIPGTLKNGYFHPTVGKQIIPFEQYRYSEKAIEIYNLPGKFVKKPEKP